MVNAWFLRIGRCFRLFANGRNNRSQAIKANGFEAAGKIRHAAIAKGITGGELSASINPGHGVVTHVAYGCLGKTEFFGEFFVFHDEKPPMIFFLHHLHI
jgi:hypothetical protein